MYLGLCACLARDWVFDFGVKFYVPEPNVLQEEITRFVRVLLAVTGSLYSLTAASLIYNEVFL